MLPSGATGLAFDEGLHAPVGVQKGGAAVRGSVQGRADGQPGGGETEVAMEVHSTFHISRVRVSNYAVQSTAPHPHINYF